MTWSDQPSDSGANKASAGSDWPCAPSALPSNALRPSMRRATGRSDRRLLSAGQRGRSSYGAQRTRRRTVIDENLDRKRYT